MSHAPKHTNTQNMQDKCQGHLSYSLCLAITTTTVIIEISRISPKTIYPKACLLPTA